MDQSIHKTFYSILIKRSTDLVKVETAAYQCSLTQEGPRQLLYELRHNRCTTCTSVARHPPDKP